MWNFLKVDLITKSYSKLQRKILKEKKVKDQIWKIVSQKKHPWKNLPKTWVYMNHSIILKKESVAKITFSLEKLYYGRISLTKFGGTFLCRLFSRCLFFLYQGENTSRKTPSVTQSTNTQNLVTGKHGKRF